MSSLNPFTIKVVSKALVTVSMLIIYVLTVNNNNIHSVGAFASYTVNRSINVITNRNSEIMKQTVDLVSSLSLRSTGQSYCGILGSKKSDNEYENDDMKEESEGKKIRDADKDIDKPIYRSKLQRLNQVQSKKNIKTKTRGKLKKSPTLSSIEQFNSSSTTTRKNDDNDNKNNKRNISSLPKGQLLGEGI